MMIDPPMNAPRRGRFPFDRIGVLALAWAVLFVAAAVGCALILG
jgi:hypothetical protein